MASGIQLEDHGSGGVTLLDDGLPELVLANEGSGGITILTDESLEDESLG